jgi:hypothetical protein
MLAAPLLRDDLLSVSNYSQLPSNGGMYMAGAITTLGVAFFCLLIRLGTKVKGSHRKLRADDRRCFG